MRRAIMLAGFVPFVSAFLGGTLAFGLVAPSLATAQPTQLPEVRASAFTLVSPDGSTVIARLYSSAGGIGILDLYDAAGTRRLDMTGNGSLTVLDQDGRTILFKAGRTFNVSPQGYPPVNGVWLGPGGSIGAIPAPE